MNPRESANVNGSPRGANMIILLVSFHLAMLYDSSACDSMSLVCYDSPNV